MKVVVIGAGILGQTHALIARERGHDVTVLERSERPLGASVRNFGTLWPIGCRPGSERRQALRGVARWRELGERLGIDVRTQGSLSLAYREEARQVHDAFAAQAGQR
ncbi:MAG: FAD-dependent oxidoreductase [Planctomycetota bacterium]|nr:FAD-dependent oxidoreductase [Planctomycetota bacterium]MEC8651808.1 FAD-dependent oxidoreductase [Planctomycetota bacterium]MEC9049128.1 FAD-dependent oxidoreductase [Planctomycetota bacterium]